MNDQRGEREVAHGHEGGPRGYKNPEVGEHFDGGAAGVEGNPPLKHPGQRQGGLADGLRGPHPRRYASGHPPKMVVEATGGPTHLRGLPRAHRTGGQPGPPRNLCWVGDRGLVNRREGCYVRGRTQLVSRWRRETGSQNGGRGCSLLPFAFGSDDDATRWGRPASIAVAIARARPVCRQIPPTAMSKMNKSK